MINMAVDEHPKPKTTLEALAKLPPVFKKGGTVTAGTASVSLIYSHQHKYINIFFSPCSSLHIYILVYYILFIIK